MSFVLRGPDAPCAGQTAAAIEGWLRANARRGTGVVVRYSAGGRLRYERGRVVDVDTQTIRVAVRRPGGRYHLLRGGFYFDGRSCWIPGVFRQLVIPTPAVLAACGPWVDDGGLENASARGGNGKR